MPLPDYVPGDWSEDFDEVQARLAEEAGRIPRTAIPILEMRLEQAGLRGLLVPATDGFEFTRPLTAREQDALIALMAREAGFDAR